MINNALKPVVLPTIDPSQFGFIPCLSTTFALISMFHHQLRATDGTRSTVRTALLDFQKAFDLIHHHILVAKLCNLGVKPTAINWITHFLRERQQKVYLRGLPLHILQLVQTGLSLKESTQRKFLASRSETTSSGTTTLARTIKATKQLYLLRQLKRAGVSSSDLVTFYCSVIRSVLEYSCQLFHSSLPSYLSDKLGHIQRCALCIIFPDLK